MAPSLTAERTTGRSAVPIASFNWDRKGGIQKPRASILKNLLSRHFIPKTVGSLLKVLCVGCSLLTGTVFTVQTKKVLTHGHVCHPPACDACPFQPFINQTQQKC